MSQSETSAHWRRRTLPVSQSGAISLGHPIGASGTRVLLTLLYEMQRRQAHYGLATLCIGGSQSVEMIVAGSPGISQALSWDDRRRQ